MGLISNKLRASAKGAPCMFQIPGVCNGDPETTVLAHIRDGHKGLGNKANDYSAAFGCSACHDTIDNHRLEREEELSYSLRALQRTMDYWVKAGLIVVSGIDPEKPKTRPRKTGNWAKGRKIQSANNLRKRA